MADRRALRELESQAATERFVGLPKKVNTDDAAEEDVRALREILEEYPGLWRAAGELAKVATQKTIRATMDVVWNRACAS